MRHQPRLTSSRLLAAELVVLHPHRHLSLGCRKRIQEVQQRLSRQLFKII
jgi:hypothetical protein